MAEQLRSGSSTASLVGEIIADAQTLIRQELALAKTELKEDWKRAKVAGIEMGTATAVGFLGAFWVGAAIIYLLNEITELPLWACFGLVGLVTSVTSAFLWMGARQRAKEVEVVPRQTLDSIKENVQWIKNRT